MVDVPSLRQAFPQFSDATVYPDSEINYWLDIASKIIASDRWGDLLDHATCLFVCHNIALEAVEQSAADNGSSLVGSVGGPVASKSVDKVSVSYDTANSLELDAGHWNTTIYGRRFLRLVRMFGAGGTQL